ncbi:flagellar hook-associated protein FlgL [Desulfovibrio sp.]|uniref:flagellar hook-associated protein FlgL n=1 Tax=Desulfovibrio TaxID=872 RepID=UPI0025C0EDA4|nr:flagellar hook-associated protein FlgL [Desulfovibrio sp.]
MAIRVTQNTMYDKMTSQMQKSLAAYMESNEQGSSQKKINRPSDDPAGTYRVLVTRNDISATTQYQSNVDTAKGWLSLADNVLGTQLSNSLTNLKALAEQASTGTYSAENRKQIADQARQIFGEMLNLSNTQYEGNSIFAGQRYDHNAFEEGLALTSADTNWDTAIQAGDYTIQGASSKSMMIQFTSTGTLDGGAQTFRWSNDGGTTWGTGTTVGRTLTANGVTVTMQKDLAVTAADTSAGAGSKNGTLVYIRPTAVYQGDDNDPPPKITTMGGPSGLLTSAAGAFGGNVLLRMDNNADLSTSGNTVNYSYSTDSGSTWIAATATTDGSNKLRLLMPSGYMDLDAGSVTGYTVNAGTQFLVHPDRADLNLEIMKDSYISVNNVGKDIFGGYYEGKPALSGSTNLFDMVGDFISYCENNNQEGCQQTLAKIATVQQNVLTQTARIGGLENRVSTASDVLSFQKLDQQDRLSYTEDIDLTELLTKLTRQQLTYQTVLQSSSKIMQMNLASYL